MFLGLRLGAHFPTARIPYTDDLPLEDESDADDSEEADEAALPSAARQARSLWMYVHHLSCFEPAQVLRSAVGHDCKAQFTQVADWDRIGRLNPITQLGAVHT